MQDENITDVTNPFADLDEVTGPNGDPGPWFIAGYDDECSRGGHGIDEGDTIRADGEGGWECKACVDDDDDDDDDDACPSGVGWDD